MAKVGATKEDGGLRRQAKEWRIKNDLSQMDVSHALGLSMNAYGQWERGGSSEMQRKNKQKLQALISTDKPKGAAPTNGVREVTCAECFELTILSWRGCGPTKFCVWCGKPLKL